MFASRDPFDPLPAFAYFLVVEPESPWMAFPRRCRVACMLVVLSARAALTRLAHAVMDAAFSPRALSLSHRPLLETPVHDVI